MIFSSILNTPEKLRMRYVNELVSILLSLSPQKNWPLSM